MNVEPFREFFSVSRIPLSVSSSGRQIGLFPFDSLAWTTEVAQIVESTKVNLRAAGRPGRVDLAITEQATGLAKAELGKAGWSVKERVSGLSR